MKQKCLVPSSEVRIFCFYIIMGWGGWWRGGNIWKRLESNIQCDKCPEQPSFFTLPNNQQQWKRSRPAPAGPLWVCVQLETTSSSLGTKVAHHDMRSWAGSAQRNMPDCQATISGKRLAGFMISFLFDFFFLLYVIFFYYHHQFPPAPSPPAEHPPAPFVLNRRLRVGSWWEYRAQRRGLGSVWIAVGLV